MLPSKTAWKPLEDRLARLTDSLGDPPIDLGKPRHQIRIGEPARTAGQQRDDLTRISNIGPFNQQQLNAVGICTYRQIADWSDDALEDYAARIGYVADIMREENWIGQAAGLAEGDEDGPKVAPEAGSRPEPTDLTVIEGIGPRIAEVLKQAGVSDWKDLSETPVEELEAMLEQAGRNFAVHQATTWPEQAALAVAGNWEALAAFKQELEGGRAV